MSILPSNPNTVKPLIFDPLETVLVALRDKDLKPKQQGKEYVAHCPAHHDKKPSLNVRRGDDGKILVICRAGCDTKNVVAELGLEMKDLFAAPPPRRKQPMVEAVYTYEDENGSPLYRKKRLAGKKFWFEQYYKGQWTKGLDKIRRVLLGLPELKQATGLVLYVEGEKDVETARKLGFVATTAGGVNDWKSEFANDFSGCELVIIPDNDKPGMDLASRVAEDCSQIAASVRIVELGGDLGNGADLTDWVEAGGSAEDLHSLFARQPIYKNQESQTLIEFKTTDYGNAERLAHFQGENLRYCRALKKWLAYDGKRWVIGATDEAMRRAKQTVRAIYREAQDANSDSRRRELGLWAVKSESVQKIEAMLRLAESELPIRPDELDKDAWLLNVNNGTIDLRTGQLKAHHRADFITKLAHVDFDSDARMPTIQVFLEEIFGSNDELIGFIKRLLGYSLTGDTSERKLPILIGSGANGKSTLLELFRALLGDYAMDTPMSSLMVKNNDTVPNDIARLKGARFVTAIEAEEGQQFAEALVKKLTGGDRITARFLHGEFFEYDPEFKIWLAVNDRPLIKRGGDAIWDRLLEVPFSVRIPEDKRENKTALLNRLKPELPGLLNWAIEGCLEWQQNKCLRVPKIVKDATNNYRNEMDVIGRFINERCTTTEGATVKSSVLYGAYKTWTMSNNEYPESNKKFSLKVEEKGFTKKRKSDGEHWQGLGLLAD